MRINLRELVIDLELSDSAILDNALIESVALIALSESGAKIRDIKEDIWQPHGLQFYAVLETSHCIFTTYPEQNYLTINYASCGNIDFDAFLAVVLRELKPKCIIRQVITDRQPQQQPIGSITKIYPCKGNNIH
jgi:S-adenosylmethionine/arginine decarboxylase-like enzyme